jgi:hypothetical protein
MEDFSPAQILHQSGAHKLLRGITAALFVSSLISLGTFFSFHYSTYKDGTLLFWDMGPVLYYFALAVAVVGSIIAVRAKGTAPSDALVLVCVIAVLFLIGFPLTAILMGSPLFVPPLLMAMFPLNLILLFVVGVVYIANKAFKLFLAPYLIATSILFLPALFYLHYINFKDFSVRAFLDNARAYNQRTINEGDCAEFVSSRRKNECRLDVLKNKERVAQELRREEEQLMAHIPFLVRDQALLQGSENYPYFPKGNIVDVRVGSGEIARYRDTIRRKILSIDINGKIYVNPKSRLEPSPFSPDGNWKLDLETAAVRPFNSGYNSYILGIVGMRIGGVRRITFQSNQEYEIPAYVPGDSIIIPANQNITYEVELISVVK